MSCGCVYVDGGRVSDFVTDRHVVARKVHRCDECCRSINPGERYEYVFGVWDGDQSTYKTCADCESVRTYFFCDQYNYGEVRTVR